MQQAHILLLKDKDYAITQGCEKLLISKLAYCYYLLPGFDINAILILAAKTQDIIKWLFSFLLLDLSKKQFQACPPA